MLQVKTFPPNFHTSSRIVSRRVECSCSFFKLNLEFGPLCISGSCFSKQLQNLKEMSYGRGSNRDSSRQNGSYESRSFQNSNYDSKSGWGNNANSSRDNPRSNDRQSQQVEGNSVVVRVPYDVVNCLTARGEAKLGELQSQSGAKIKVKVLKTHFVVQISILFLL